MYGVPDLDAGRWLADYIQGRIDEDTATEEERVWLVEYILEEQREGDVTQEEEEIEWVVGYIQGLIDDGVSPASYPYEHDIGTFLREIEQRIDEDTATSEERILLRDYVESVIRKTFVIYDDEDVWVREYILRNVDDATDGERDWLRNSIMKVYQHRDRRDEETEWVLGYIQGRIDEDTATEEEREWFRGWLRDYVRGFVDITLTDEVERWVADYIQQKADENTATYDEREWLREYREREEQAEETING